jgi:hypothetical protein
MSVKGKGVGRARIALNVLESWLADRVCRATPIDRTQKAELSKPEQQGASRRFGMIAGGADAVGQQR